MYNKNTHSNKVSYERTFYLVNVPATIKAAQWYTVKEGGATMLPIAHMPGPKMYLKQSTGCNKNPNI